MGATQVMGSLFKLYANGCFANGTSSGCTRLTRAAPVHIVWGSTDNSQNSVTR